MPVLTLFSLSHSHENAVIKALISKGRYRDIEAEIFDQITRRFHVSKEKIIDACRGRVSIFNSFTREREKHLLYIKSALSRMIHTKGLLISGYFSHLVPLNIPHVLKVCLAAPLGYRVKKSKEAGKFSSEKEAVKALKEDEVMAAKWTGELRGKGPFDPSLYDMKLPLHEISVDEAISNILENASKPAVQITSESKEIVQDFKLNMDIRLALMESGHLDVSVESRNGNAVITIHKKVLRMEHLSRELHSIGIDVEGVKEIEVVAGPEIYQANIYRKQDFEMPKKVLLVDDEKDFVRTLSERLQLRDFGTAVAYSGEDALSMASKDVPEVMLLDLRMPGIDGLEVLRKLKASSPETEVIILTGHGSAKDREQAMALGAFDYLEKPADIDKISNTMKRAYDKIQNRKGNTGQTD